MRLILKVFILTFFSSSMAIAISLSEFIVPLTDESKRVFIGNKAESDAFVDITIDRVFDAGMSDEKKEKFNTGDNPEEFGLIVPATAVVIPAQDRKYISLIPTQSQSEDEERVFLVTVTPFEGMRNGKQYTADSKVQAGVKIIFSYQIKVIQLPKSIDHNLQIKELNKTETGTEIQLINQGNVYERVAIALLCPSSEKAPNMENVFYDTNTDKNSKCKDVGAAFLYPNNTQDYTVPKGNTLYLLIRRIKESVSTWPVKTYKAS